MPRPEEIKLMNQDVLVQPVAPETGSPIIQLDSRQDDIMHYKVIKVAEKCTEVQAGDTILLKFGDHTPAFMLDGGYYAITSEPTVLAII